VGLVVPESQESRRIGGQHGCREAWVPNYQIVHPVQGARFPSVAESPQGVIAGRSVVATGAGAIVVGEARVGRIRWLSVDVLIGADRGV
jgi:hypothetical protein